MSIHVHLETGRPLQKGLIPTSRGKLAAATPFRPIRAGTLPPFFFIFPRKLSMWLNDQYGDCVTAEEAFNKACFGVFIEDATVQTWASKNDVLNGANLEPVIQQMQAKGFEQDSNIYGDGAALAVDYTDAPTLQNAIYTAGQKGGCIKLGIASGQLPSGAGNTNGWFLTTDQHDNNEDHCVSACGYGTAQDFVTAMNAAFGLSLTVPSGVDPNMQGYAVYTWKTIGFVSVPAFLNMTGEAWIRNPSSVDTGTGTPDPDSVYTTGGPTPVPPGPTPVPPGPTPVPPGPSPIQQWVDNLFMALATAHPILSPLILYVKGLVDQYLFKNPQLRGQMVVRGQVKDVVDTIFAALEASAGPIERTVLVVVQGFADQWMTAHGW